MDEIHHAKGSVFSLSLVVLSFEKSYPWFALPQKGYIAVNGCSLTIGEVEGRNFSGMSC